MYPAKILLFGEYSLLHGSKALSVPFKNFGGAWSKDSQGKRIRSLAAFSDYIKAPHLTFPFTVDTQRFLSDLDAGLYFDSSIPVGYGIGSSGALCAAFYNEYVTDPIPSDCANDRLPALKNHLSLLEHHFHSTSSGIDPLVSYTNSPILAEGNGNLTRLDTKHITPSSLSIFLIDTAGYGSTGANIRIFKELINNDAYFGEFQNSYIPLVETCISLFLAHDTKGFFASLLNLTEKQEVLFEAMIPPRFLKYFKIAKQSGQFSLKLCGSGGGGFLLGFTQDKEYVARFFEAEGVPVQLVSFHS